MGNSAEYEKAKKDTERWTPRLLGAQYATGEEWKNNSRRIEETEPKKNNAQLQMWLVMEVKSHGVKKDIA